MFPWIILGLCVLGFGFLGLFNWWQHRGPALTGRATVLSHRVAVGRSNGTKYSRGGWNFYITFRLADGEELELSVFESQFSAIKDGTTGQLTWCRDNLYDFAED